MMSSGSSSSKSGAAKRKARQQVLLNDAKLSKISTFHRTDHLRSENAQPDDTGKSS